jgi:hypothetical protein
MKLDHYRYPIGINSFPKVKNFLARSEILPALASMGSLFQSLFSIGISSGPVRKIPALRHATFSPSRRMGMASRAYCFRKQYRTLAQQGIGEEQLHPKPRASLHQISHKQRADAASCVLSGY